MTHQTRDTPDIMNLWVLPDILPDGRLYTLPEMLLLVGELTVFNMANRRSIAARDISVLLLSLLLLLLLPVPPVLPVLPVLPVVPFWLHSMVSMLM